MPTVSCVQCLIHVGGRDRWLIHSALPYLGVLVEAVVVVVESVVVVVVVENAGTGVTEAEVLHPVAITGNEFCTPTNWLSVTGSTVSFILTISGTSLRIYCFFFFLLS